MAGTAIVKLQNTYIRSKTAHLNRSLHSLPVRTSCCFLVQQPQVVESTKSNKCNINNKPMKQNITKNCLNSSCGLDDRILINYNYNIKPTLHKKQQSTKQRPFALGLVVLIMSLTILFIQMPTMVNSKSIYADITNKDSESVAETKSQLLLSLLAGAQPKEQVSSLTDDSLSDSLDVLDVLKHKQQHRRERRIRLRKRHTGDLIINKYLHETAHNLEWKNPCNVEHVNMEIDAHRVNKQQVYQYLRKFERDVGMEYELITAIANTINIDDMADWNKHDDLYKFLPKLNANGSMALSRWYRNMQVFVGSFGYLARSQYHFDLKKQMFVGQTSEELNKLLASARFILCELETTINGSAPNNNLKKLKTLSRKAMNSRLNFVTKHQLANGGVVAANIVDLKFTKYCYYQFLLNMQKVLQQKLHLNNKKYGVMGSQEENNGSTLIVGDDNSSLDFSSIFKSDSSLSVGESVEMLLKSPKKPQKQRRRLHKRKSLNSTEA